MNELVLPEIVATQLQGLPHPVTLFNASGQPLGCFVPAVDSSLYEIVGPEPSAKELDRIEESNEWFSTNDVLGRLEKLR